MWRLALRRGARVAVVAAQWRDTFALVTSGRVQLELRDGEPGPVLGPGAGFWLRGTGVRALRNPGRRTARVRILTRRAGTVTGQPTHPVRTVTGAWRQDMISINDIRTGAAPASGRTGRGRRLGRLAGTGFLATLAAMAATTLAAALARAIGVDFEIPDGGESIPLAGFTVVTGFFSVVGVVIAVALLRWSARPAERFLWTAASLTVISMILPLVCGADSVTTTALMGLHLVPAAVMIPTLVRGLRTRTD
ncbi:DUF6069 family protein [Micromonospora andamanensis]|uniref:Uncharacterized protein n=1 Tax=Micromonospora andamanensis TaxID=1287068 RepID=A0ABQ4HZ84_9ACTN|nr:DUF6069 family protein [Micromonospora andamanensis]GIJ10974.1 hypothetical protein Van01_41880 [Micromonospora andamanensis]GIJ41756.1 hypothetical protein Vwe01_50810 [Micromonospora andamanensis]